MIIVIIHINETKGLRVWYFVMDQPQDQQQKQQKLTHTQRENFIEFSPIFIEYYLSWTTFFSSVKDLSDSLIDIDHVYDNWNK